MSADPDLLLADALLGDSLDLPVLRARRIAGLYAALYLEDPLLHQWGGLAAFVARHIHLAMESAEGLYEGFVSQGNLDIYRATMPAFLRFRRRNDETGPLRRGFGLLLRADGIAARDPAFARRIAHRGLSLLTETEQREIVQPAYDRLGPIQARLLAPLLRFRLGWDTACPVIDFDGSDPRQAEQRLHWANDEVLPRWQREFTERPERLRADLERVRRWAGVRMGELPAVNGGSRPGAMG
jgi:hypothetical protein